MAYQRLQVTRALPVHATTTGINIPDPDFAGITGTNATSATSKLTVAAADTFTANTVQTGYIVENVSTGAYARVAAIDSGTQLSLSGNIFSTAGDTYQIDRSLEAFANGGVVGTGPGEGEIKDFLPDAHADFIFAVTGEEFGALVALALMDVFRRVPRIY